MGRIKVFEPLKIFVLTILAIVLSACGGDSGGGGETKTSSDTTAPAITVLGDNPATINQGEPYTDAGATAEDDVDGSVTVTTSGSVDADTVGTYTITYQAVDNSGNKATAKRIVNVLAVTGLPDTNPPVITVLGDNPATINQGEAYTDAGATAEDAVDGSVEVTSEGSVDTQTVGTYTITYRASDASGNQATAQREVDVVAVEEATDTTPPIITVLGDNPTTIHQGDSYTDAGATAEDEVDGSVDVTRSGSVDTNTVGSYTITYEASDEAGNQVTATRTVNVEQAPGAFVTIEQGLSSISMVEGEEKLVAYVVKFTDGDATEYNIELEQTITPLSGVSFTSNYPLGGWVATEDSTWVVNVTLSSVMAGEYQLKSVVTLNQTGQTRELVLPITVSGLASKNAISLSTPGSDKDAITAGNSESVVFTAKVIGTTSHPESISLEQVDQSGTTVLANLGSLVDDGIGEDIVEGDFVYTGAVPISEDTVGELYFRVTTEGVSSKIHTLAVTEFPTSVAPSNSASLVSDDKGNQIYTDELLVTFIDGTSVERIKEIVSLEKGTVVGTILSLGIYQVEIDANQSLDVLDQAIQNLMAYDAVEYAEYSVKAEVAAYPNDSNVASQSNMETIRANEAWKITRGNTLISIVDTGVDYGHAELRNKVIQGKDYVSADDDPMDEDGHGTHVAGIAAAESNNSSGVAGVSWGSKVLAVRGIGGSFAALVSAVRYSADRGSKVINISGGAYFDSISLQRVIDYAVSKEALIVSTAGNDGLNKRAFPCYYSDVVCVGNSTNMDDRAASSNFGLWVDIAAPGQSVISTQLGGGTTTKSGTSMAAPLVSGAAAIVWTQHPEFTAMQVRERLIGSGKAIDPSLLIGSNRLDLFEAAFNGSFELGDLSEWGASGTASSITELGSGSEKLVPIDGKRMALLSTGPAEDQIETTLKKSFDIQPGVTEIQIEFTYNFITEEYPEFLGSPFNDILLITLTLPDGSQKELIKESLNDSEFTLIEGLDFPGGDETVGQTGFKPVSVTIPVTEGEGEYRINISDQQDDVFDSVLLIDQIRIK